MHSSQAVAERTVLTASRSSPYVNVSAQELASTFLLTQTTVANKDVDTHTHTPYHAVLSTSRM